jgi:uncharacterized membrane protein
MIPVQHIHPMLVHFPIAFVFVLAVFDIVATLRGSSVTARGAVGNVSTGLAVLAAVFAVAAYFFGDVALSIAEHGGFSSDVAETHETLGIVTAAALSIWAFIRAALWWLNRPVEGAAAAVFPVVAIAAVLLISATGYYGGQLVFDLGVNVAKSANAN